MLTMSHRDAITLLGGAALAENRLAGFEQVARMTGLTFSMVKRLFHGETSDPPASVERALELALAQGGMIAKGTRHDLALLAGRLDEQEERLAALERLLRGGAGADLCAAGPGLPPPRPGFPRRR